MEGTPAPTTRGPKFLGSYVYQLDEKGRVSLPAAFRREAPDQRFVLLQAYPPALALYPEAEWCGVEDRLRELVRTVRESQELVSSLLPVGDGLLCAVKR